MTAVEDARSRLGKDDERHGKQWSPIPTLHMPADEPVKPWAFVPKPPEL